MGWYKMSEKEKAKIIKVVKVTPGKRHAWCETNYGGKRKDINSISSDLMKEYFSQIGEINVG
jgi:hypothetical protein